LFGGGKLIATVCSSLIFLFIIKNFRGRKSLFGSFSPFDFALSKASINFQKHQRAAEFLFLKILVS